MRESPALEPGFKLTDYPAARRLDIDCRGCPRAEHGQLARPRNGTRPEASRTRSDAR